MTTQDKGCHNCVHRYGFGRGFWKCGRTGFHVETELKFGGRCAEGTSGQVLRLWSPRPSLLRRVINIVARDSA